MATLTMENLSQELVERIRKTAERRGRSVEQEIRDLLEQRYSSRKQILERCRRLWNELPRVDAEEVRSWREEGRDS